MRSYDIFQVDAFTSEPFGGNPAAVIPDARGLGEEDMQKIAREMNLSETAFVFDDPADETFRVRFFTPTDEVDLCGHATIATFYLLADLDFIDLSTGRNKVYQKTNAGLLPVEVYGIEDETTGKTHVSKVMMHQARPEVTEEIEEKETVADFLGLDTDEIGGERGLPLQVVSTGLPDLIVPVRDKESLYDITPNFDAMIEFCEKRGIISVHAFAFSEKGNGDPVDAHCRDFSPAVGITEEAATGTASGALGAYLVLNGPEGWLGERIEEAKVHFSFAQGLNLDRPSRIEVEVETNRKDDENRGSRYEPGLVKVGGQAIVVLKGRLRL